MNNSGFTVNVVEVGRTLEIKKNRRNRKRIKKRKNIRKIKGNTVHLNLNHLRVSNFSLKSGVEVDKGNTTNRFKLRQDTR